MKTLLIIANPSKTSFTHAMADTYKKSAISQGHQVEVLDLYDIDQDILYFESMDHLKKNDFNGGQKMIDVQEKITWSEEMVYFFPIWWGNIPAILKNFFDLNFSAGYAFKFVRWKLQPDGLLAGRTAKVYCHGDAPAIVYKIPVLGIHIKRYLGVAILGTCGVKLKKYMSVGWLRKKTDKQRRQILEKVSQL